ncbi:DNA polymerase subunit Cdc27 [Boletus reticuloceps]|uniref:DNA polymerase delta subunit 3 n=1 Tax=Boletus reticuloceps TaxID=495285 RepID=A0A8I2YF99_9AGAM|nr:DNA polymerase subunit Cdc27 [Boletus reticuloceps]
MTTKKARDFLDKELFVKRGIVTFRSLSRELGIHVNDAKDELQCYYDAVRDTDAPAVPTYLVSGEVPALTVDRHSETQQSESAMDMDPEFEEDWEETDVVCQSKVLLVDNRILDEAMSQFSRVHSVHIYSLSPSRFVDAGLVCTPSIKVHKADAKGGPEFFSVVGKIMGSHVKLRDGAVDESVASSSKTTLDLTVAPKLAGPTKAEHQMTKGKALSSDTKGQIATTPLQRTESKEKPKLSGKLDWSKAKTKTKEKEPVTEKKREEKRPKPEPDSPVAAMHSSTSRKTGLEPTKSSALKSKASDIVSSDSQKRGMKRKPLIDTDQESESESSSVKAKPSTAGGSSVKRGVVYSDEDEDGEVRMLCQRRRKRKGTVTSDSEMSLRAIMDIDDRQVDRVSRADKVLPQPEELEESEEEGNKPEKEATAPPATTEDEESDHVPVVPKRRKPRKVALIGRNGLKKRRVIKSRTTMDAKGYMQTEDYSSHESVEEEEVIKPKGKGKGKGKETKKASELIDKDEEVKPKIVAQEKLKAKPTPKPRGGAPKRGGLLNFFGPERGKK